MAIDENAVNEMVSFYKGSRAEYELRKESGNLDPNGLYFTIDEETGKCCLFIGEDKFSDVKSGWEDSFILSNEGVLQQISKDSTNYEENFNNSLESIDLQEADENTILENAKTFKYLYCYDRIQDMVEATYLMAGMTALVKGGDYINDGNPGIFHIRHRRQDDNEPTYALGSILVSNSTIIFLNNGNVAELVYKYISNVGNGIAERAEQAAERAERASDSAVRAADEILGIGGQQSNYNSVPIGTIIMWASSNDPLDGGTWFDCDGRVFSRYAYPTLYTVLGSEILPDLRGLFPRCQGSQSLDVTIDGVSSSQTFDAGQVGSKKSDSMRSITGSISNSSGYGVVHSFLTGESITCEGSLVLNNSNINTGLNNFENNGHSYNIDIDTSKQVPTDEEIRPASISLRFLIKAL